MPAPAAPTQTIEIEFTPGVWTDVTASVDVDADSVTRKVGRANAVDEISPGTLSFTLQNSTGAFTPDNPLSVYYPNVVEGKQVRWKVTGTAGVKQRFLGTITDLTPTVRAFDDASIEVTAIDRLGLLASRDAYPLPEAHIRALSPRMYWRLNDATFPAVDVVTARRLSLALRPGATTTPRDALADLDLTDDLYVRFVPAKVNGTAEQAVGEALVTDQAIGFESQNDWSVCFAARPVRYTTFMIPTALAWGTPSGGGGFFRLIYDSGTPRFDYTDTDGANVFYDSTEADLEQAHFWTVTCAFSGSCTLKIYKDGVLVATDTNAVARGPAITDRFAIGNNATIGVEQSSDFPGYYGSIGHVAVWDRGLTQAEAERLGAAWLGYAGSTVKDLATDVAKWAGVTLTPDAAFGPQPVAALDATATGKVIDQFRLAVRGDGAVAWDDGTDLVARAGSALRSETVALELNVEEDLAAPLDLIRSTDQQVSTATASSSAVQTLYTDPVLVASIGSISVDLPVPHARAVDAEAVASGRVATAKQTRLRITKAVIEVGTASTDRYAAIQALRIGDRVRLLNLPSQQFGLTYTDAYLQGFTETLSMDAYRFVLDLEPADAPPVGRFDNGTFTTFDRFGDNGDLTLTAPITVGATSLQVTCAGSGTLSTSAGSYPLLLNVNGEIVSVTSAPASAVSPQTLTVVRAQQGSVARAHVAGEPISVYSAICFAP